MLSRITVTACTRNGFVRTIICIAKSLSSFPILLLSGVRIRSLLTRHQIFIGVPPSNVRESLQFVHNTQRAANRILGTAAETLELHPPTFNQFLRLARSYYARMTNTSLCTLAAQSGQIWHQPAMTLFDLVAEDIVIPACPHQK